VIPTLGKRIEYLNFALKTVDSQIFKPKEILLVNNGAKSIVNELISTDVPLREFIIPFGAGVSQARNFGASLAATPYVSFLDDDDFWHLDYLEHVVVAISSNPDIVLSRLDKYHTDETSVKFMNAADRLFVSEFLLFNPGATGSNTTVLRTSFLGLGGFDPKLPPAEDGALVLDALLNGLKVIVQPAAISYMRIHPGDRLTDPRFAFQGYWQFYLKYKKQMSFRTKVFNLWRIYREKAKSSKLIFSKILFLLLSVAITLLRVTPKSIWRPESVQQ
jgi:glycosyltransferase involved in cell wall biosynthesis